MFRKIKEARKRKGMTQSELAAASGVSRATIIGLESGHITDTKIGTLRKIADALGITMDDIFFADSVRHSKRATANNEEKK